MRLYCWAWVVLAPTNDDGRFFATLPTNSHLSIEAFGADGKTRGWTHVDERVHGTGARPVTPTLTLKPPKQVTVRVNDGDHMPVQGATVILIGAGYPYDAPRTSETGETTLQVPADLEADSVMAWKDGVGLDYTATRDSGTSAGPGGPPLNTDRPITLELSRGPTVRFRIVDQADQPVVGQHFDPWVFRKQGAPHSFNTTHFHGRNTRLTDQNGEVAFDWPTWQKEQITFSGWDRRYSRADVTLGLSEDTVKPTTIRIQRYATVRGQVLGLDGNPAPDTFLVARGPAWKEGDSQYAGNGIADPAGRFELYLPSKRPYQIVAVSRDGKQISPPEERYLDDPDRTIDDIVLYLRPAIRVFGHLPPRDINREDARPRLRLVGEDLRTRQDIKLPRTDSLEPIRSVEEIQIDPEANGDFLVLVGPGRYEFVPAKNAPGIPFELIEQSEYEVHIPPP